MDAYALACSANERPLGRPGAAADHGFLLAGPAKDRFGAGIIGNHAFVIVIGMVGQRLDGCTIAGLQCQGRRNLLAEIAPVHGLG